MTLSDMKQQVDAWVTSHAGGYWSKFEIIARITEELGEIAAALQRLEGLRPRRVEVDLQGEAGDLLFTLVGFANTNEIGLSKRLPAFPRRFRVVTFSCATSWPKTSVRGSNPSYCASGASTKMTLKRKPTGRPRVE